MSEPASPALGSEIAALLRRRADRLAMPAPAPDDDAVVWIAELPLGDERYALRLDTLRGVVALRNVTPVPLSPPDVVGVLRFQGQLVTAFSLAALLGGRSTQRDPTVLVLVDAGPGHLVALDCEETPKPMALPTALWEAARTEQRGALVEITTGDLRVVSLIDLPRLLEARR